MGLINLEMLQKEGTELVAYFHKRGIDSALERKLIMNLIVDFENSETTRILRKMEEKKNGTTI